MGSSVLPEPLAGPGDGTVLAQSSVESGTPDACPPSYTAKLDNCELETSACPRSPVTGELMSQSVVLIKLHPASGVLPTPAPPLYQYPDFCEERILKPVDSAGYDDCTNATGIITMTHVMAQQTDADGNRLVDGDGHPLLDPAGTPGLDADGVPVTVKMCRLLANVQCAAGLHRKDSDVCRAVTRRTWKCPKDTVAANDFNTCYRPQAPPKATHPACGAGAPALVALTCEEYVAGDFLQNPANEPCKDLETGSALQPSLLDNTLAGAAAAHWCQFDAALLKVECHAAHPPASQCAPTTARCLKRASRTGGCSAVAATIRCRAEQATFRAGTLTPQQVQEKVEKSGCRPCVVLPFSPPPPDCPDQYRSEPTAAPSVHSFRYEIIHRVKQSIAIGSFECSAVRSGADLSSHPRCAAEGVCDGAAPRGRMTWTSAHGSGLAIVNESVVLTLDEIPGMPEGRLRSVFTGAYFELFARDYLLFADDLHGDPTIRIWPEMDGSETYSTVTEYLRVRDSQTCLLGPSPEVRVTIQELWPDASEQRGEILRFFGSAPLDWWDSLDIDERRRRTEARGMTLLADLTSDVEKERERAARAAELSEEVLCNYGTIVWCRWRPGRAGYFKATAASAWLVEQERHPRLWLSDAQRADRVSRLNSYLGGNSSRVEGFLNRFPLTAKDLGLKRASDGLEVDLAAWENLPGDEWLFSDQAARKFRCPSVTLFVLSCGDTVTAGNYTTSEPVGIQVHEIRVVARTPRL